MKHTNDPAFCAPYIVFILILLLPCIIQAQTHITITGDVYAKKSNSLLPFASVNLKNKFKGTVANKEGFFAFTLPIEHLKDTLEISFIGYEKKEILIDTIQQHLKVELTASNFVLSEIVLSPLGPEDYIKLAVKHMPANFPKSPYLTQAYFSNEITVNKKKLSHEESFFNTYHHVKNDSIDHQLLLYKKNEFNPEDLDFFYEETSIDLEGIYNSPDFILDRGKTNSNEQDLFLDSLNFKKFEYRFNPIETPGYHTILFKSKKPIYHMELSGEILIERASYAIVAVNYEGRIKIPLKIKPILFLAGFGIENPVIKSNRTYRNINDVWYLDFIEIEAYIEVEKKKLFKPNKQFNAKFYQVFNVNNTLIKDVKPLPSEKLFNPTDHFESQIYNEYELKWSQINTVRP
ncbi:MAG: carboxypeptidase-like regulatory domain-containing protein [Flavobacteriales bacterium]|nr:carboxypeptidase-like regulatory domain-containing protein [Flavobacteriales bacterium]